MNDQRNDCCGDGNCEDKNCEDVSRRDFVKSIGIGSALFGGASGSMAYAYDPKESQAFFKSFQKISAIGNWPVLKTCDQEHVSKIALPLGGIGTGTVSLGGRGDLRDWEIMNRPAKGFVPMRDDVAPFFAIHAKPKNSPAMTRVLEGPLEAHEYEGSHGSDAPNDNLPRFRYCSFAAAYPFGQVALNDPDAPVEVIIKAFNPLIPADADRSGIPAAVLTYSVKNIGREPADVSVCGNILNFIGMNGWNKARDWKGDDQYVGAKTNQNEFRKTTGAQGVFMRSEGVDPLDESWGTMALAARSDQPATYRADWEGGRWGNAFLQYWDDFHADGRLENPKPSGSDIPIGSLALSGVIEPGKTRDFTFILTWHFPHRVTWTTHGESNRDKDRIGNYYATQYADAWDVAEKTLASLERLEADTLTFVNALCESTLPETVKEAALFNVSTLRTQTCFRTTDGRFYGFEGSGNNKGCCWGSCTHVWNYEQAAAFLFGELAMSMREVEFAHATDDAGLMSFRVELPLEFANGFGKAAADGQMGTIMKMYRDWRLSGDEKKLKTLWPSVKRALEFCWIDGGWDADQDGVMEGCQHNTMDVEYYGPNPQMGIWYLGALRAAEEMAARLGDASFASKCRLLFESGREWIDRNLFNGEYYEHEIRPIADQSQIAPSLLIGMGSADFSKPDYQLGSGCLVDQLVGQTMAHVCGLGYLTNPEHVKKTLASIKKYNRRENLTDHFNSMRSFALGEESALLMASYPKDRPRNPFPYFTEAMTGFEYTAAVGMLYEGMEEDGLESIQHIRDRYDGKKRNPFNEAECGHHYARAMASWAAVLALSGFQYSAVDQSISFAKKKGIFFWSTGYAWGTCEIRPASSKCRVTLNALHGTISLKTLSIAEYQTHNFAQPTALAAGAKVEITLQA